MFSRGKSILMVQVTTEAENLSKIDVKIETLIKAASQIICTSAWDQQSHSNLRKKTTNLYFDHPVENSNYLRC